MRHLPRALLAGGIGFAVSCLAACGGGAGLLSGNQAGSLQNRLDQVSVAVSSHNCTAADRSANGLVEVALGLPTTVNHTLRSDLAHGALKVRLLASQQCHRRHTTSTSTTATTTTTTAAPTTTATTPTTTTATTQTTTPTTPTTTPTTPTTTTSTTSSSGGSGVHGNGGGNGGANAGNGKGAPGAPAASGPGAANG